MNLEPHCPGVRGTLDEVEYHLLSVEEGEQHGEAIVRAVAIITDQDPLQMTPLGSVIDPDGIHSIFDSNANGPPVCLEFEYEGCYIIVNRTHIWVGEAT